VTITCSLANQPIGKVKVDLVVVPVFAKRVLGPGADEVDRALGGELVRFMTEAGFGGEPDETLMVPVAGMGAKTALLVGVGPRDDVSVVTLRRAGAAIARRATSAVSVATTVAGAAPEALTPEAAAYAVAEGVALGAYQYLAFKTKGEPTKLRKFVLVGNLGDDGGKAVTAALARARVVTDAVAWARDIVNEPSLTKSPADFAASAKKLLAGKGVSVTVLTEPQIRAQKMGGVIGVGQGSERPPRFVKVVYDPPGGRARGTLALVGKGVTFDTGGISIKPADGMEAMKTDMGGAAAALGAMSTLKALGVKHRVVSYVPMVENMPSGNAIRPGDVLRMRDGQTVEVLNTDAEGRLILADALAWAVDEKPDAIVDLATLTGACVVALGEKVAGLMGNNDSWSAQVHAAADRAGEPMWHLPLPDDYRKNLESDVADLRNISSTRYGGALTAGLFLEAFVDERPWVHLDIAGPARASADDGELTRGGTGFGVRTLVELARTYEPPTPKKPAKKVTAKKVTAKKVTAKKVTAKKVTAKKVTAKKASRG